MIRCRHALVLSILGFGCQSDPVPPVLDGGTIDIPATDLGASDLGPSADRGTTDTGAPVDRGPPADNGPTDTGPQPDVPTCTAPVPLGDLTGTPWCDLPIPAPTGLTAPSGFCIRRYGNVRTARVLAFAPNGDLFVASPSTDTPGGAPPGLGSVVVLADDNHDGLADAPRTFFTGVDSVHGLLFLGNELLYTTQTSVAAAPYCNGDRAATAPVAMHRHVATLTGAVRWTHTLAYSADGRLFVSMGQYDTSQCPAPDPRAGSILQIGAGMPDMGSIVVAGFRNPMYMRCKEWGACFAAELSGDGWDGIGGREKLIEMHDGDRYGFPCCVDRGQAVPGVSMPGMCNDIAATVGTFPLHNTPFGFDWAPSSWPAPYGGSFFVAQHGYVGAWVGAGVYWAPVDAMHRPTAMPSAFISGFGHRSSGGIEQRVSDLVFARDGRAFVADDQSGDVYWIAPATLRMPAH